MQINYTIEDLGKLHNAGVEVEVEFEIHEGEARINYDRNGDGYPGSPAYVEVVSAKVEELFVETNLGYYQTTFRENNEEWFAILDKIAYDVINEEITEFTDYVFDKVE